MREFCASCFLAREGRFDLWPLIAVSQHHQLPAEVEACVSKAPHGVLPMQVLSVDESDLLRQVGRLHLIHEVLAPIHAAVHHQVELVVKDSLPDPRAVHLPHRKLQGHGVREPVPVQPALPLLPVLPLGVRALPGVRAVEMVHSGDLQHRSARAEGSAERLEAVQQQIPLVVRDDPPGEEQDLGAARKAHGAQHVPQGSEREKRKGREKRAERLFGRRRRAGAVPHPEMFLAIPSGNFNLDSRRTSRNSVFEPMAWP